MRFLCSNLFFFLMMLTAMPVLGDDSPAQPQWPLDLNTRYLTSNFMEFRSGRFHAGLDLKTETRQGYTVRAVEDGYISRLRCTPTAYGRVVYLRGESGRTYVFAHMSRFNDDLRNRVERVQQQKGTYRARLEFKPNQIRVKKGDVLGLSGQSGTNGPHLHFEVRDRNQRPINPLDEGFGVEDTIAPVIHSLRVWPTDAETRINGTAGERVIKAEPSVGLKGHLGVINVNGPVAFSARMIDASDIRGHKLEPWLISLEIDGEVVYSCRNDRYAFSENALQRLEWTNWADWTDKGVPREHWLHRRPANTLTGREGELWYLGTDGSGLESGDHHFVLTVVDHAGGGATVDWIVRVGKEADVFTKSDLWLQEPLGIGGNLFPEMDPISAEALRLTPFFSTGDPEYNGLKVMTLHPGAGDPVLESVEIWLKRQNPDSEMKAISKSQGLQFAGWGQNIYAADWPIESSVPLPLDFIDAQSASINTETDFTKGAGVYRLKNNKTWNYVGPCSVDKTKLFHFEEPGLHAVFIDVLGPVFQQIQGAVIVGPGPVSELAEVSLPHWGATAITLDDLGSGVDTSTLKARLDGYPLIVEPDPPRDRILIEWPDDLAVGDHELQLWVSDAAGNPAEAVYELKVGPY